MFLEESKWLVSRIIEENQESQEGRKITGQAWAGEQPTSFTEGRNCCGATSVIYRCISFFYSNYQPSLRDYHANQAMKVGTKDRIVPLNLNLKKNSVLKFILKIAQTTLQIPALLR